MTDKQKIAELMLKVEERDKAIEEAARIMVNMLKTLDVYERGLKILLGQKAKEEDLPWPFPHTPSGEAN